MPQEIVETLTAHGPAMAGGLAILAAAVLTLRGVRRRRAIDDCLTRLTDLQAMVAAFGQSLIAMDAAITRLDARIAEFTERNLEIQSQFAFNRAFEEASRMVRDGDSAESVVSACGLSAAEAALMVRLHRAGGQGPSAFRKTPAESPAPIANVASSADETDAASSEKAGQGMADEEIRLREVLKAARRA